MTPMSKTIHTLLVEQKKMYEMYEERIRQLVSERDAARWEVCELSGNGSIDSAMREAEQRGWSFEQNA